MRRVDKIKLLLILGFMVLGPILLSVIAVISHRQTTCLFDAIGLGCLGCNGLSALQALKQGSILEALKLNPLIMIWLSIGTVIIIEELYQQSSRYITKNNKRDSLLDKLIKWMFRGIDFKEG